MATRASTNWLSVFTGPEVKSSDQSAGAREQILEFDSGSFTVIDNPILGKNVVTLNAQTGVPSGGSGGNAGVGLYSEAPSAVATGAGALYVPTDLLDDWMLSNGTIWLHRQCGTFVTPPSTAASATTAINTLASATLEQKGPFWRYARTAYDAGQGYLRGFVIGDIAKDGSNRWSAELGVANHRSWWQHKYGSFGFFGTDGTKAVMWTLYIGGGDADDGTISAHYWTDRTASITSTSTPFLWSIRNLASVNFVKVRFDGTNYNIYTSQDGSEWRSIFSDTGFAPAFGAPFVPTQWGIGSHSCDSENLQFGWPATIDVVHLRQFAG